MTTLAAATEVAPRQGRLGALSVGDVALVVASFGVSRSLLILVGLYTLTTHAGWLGAGPLLPDLFVRWDSQWYIGLARSGYSTAQIGGDAGATNYAFYPLYPALMRLLASATGVSLAMAGVLISNACFLASLFVIFLLAQSWSADKAVARMTVVLLCLVPEGFIFSAVYTESLFLLLSSAAMLLFERKQNFAAGLCTALSSAVRSNGVFVALYLGLNLLRERGWRRTLRFWDEPERYLPLAMAPLGLFAFWWISMLSVGDAFAQKSTVLHGWAWHADWPWNNIVHAFLRSDPRMPFFMTASLVMFGISLMLLRRTTWPLFAYCAINFLLYWTGTNASSLLRYCIVLFPILFGLAWWLRGRLLPSAAVLIVFTTFGAMLMALWALASPWVL